MTNKKSEPNPIEKAIGDRATKGKETSDPKVVKTGDPYQTSGENQIPIRQSPKQIPDEPSPSEMQTLEELNWITVERLQDQFTGGPIGIGTPKSPLIPVLKQGLTAATKTSTPESPPQGIEEIDEYQDAEKGPQFELSKEISVRGCSLNFPAEDIELTNLKKYILEDGFVVATVAFHIVSLCAEPLMTHSTTMWDFKDRANIPDMVFALLNQPGYLEGIWPSLKIVMGSNAGNSAWSAGISTTIAFFDVVRTLPALKELQNEEKP